MIVSLLTRVVSASDPHDILNALGWWALWAFCTHVAIARLVPLPYGALISYLSVFVFLLAFKVVMPALKGSSTSHSEHAAHAEAASR